MSFEDGRLSLSYCVSIVAVLVQTSIRKRCMSQTVKSGKLQPALIPVEVLSKMFLFISVQRSS